MTDRELLEAAAKAKVEAEAHAKAVAEIKEREAAQGTPQERGRGDAQLTHHNPVDEASAIKDRGAAIGGVQGANQWPTEVIKHTRPTRMQIIEAVAQHFGMSVLAADEMLRGEFAGVSTLRLWGYIQPSDVPLFSRAEKVYVVDEEGFDGCTIALYIKENQNEMHHL